MNNNKAVSENLSAAIQVCQELTPSELFDLKASITKNRKMVCKDEWQSAIEIILTNLITKPFSNN